MSDMSEELNVQHMSDMSEELDLWYMSDVSEELEVRCMSTMSTMSKECVLVWETCVVSGVEYLARARAKGGWRTAARMAQGLALP